MKATVIKITPKVAENYLLNNKGNRKISERIIRHYVHLMKTGQWKENGESIVFDVNGVLKDGQHRLEAILRSGKTFRIPVVEGVESDVMATIDTGKNRSLHDILQLNGFAQPNRVAALTVKLLPYSKGYPMGKDIRKRRAYKKEISMKSYLDFAYENQEGIYRLIRETEKLHSKATYKVLSLTDVAFYLYVIGGYDFNDFHLTFIKSIIGIRHKEGSAATWLHKKIYNAKVNKDPINKYWVLGLIIKSWNLFAQGDIPVKYLQFNIDAELPEVENVYAEAH